MVDWSRAQDPFDLPIELRIPVHEAFQLGFIDAEERRLRMAEAREETLQQMVEIVSCLHSDQRDRRDALLQAMSDTRLFRDIANDLGINFTVVKATWLWPGTSVAEEFLAGTRAEAVEWLANRAYLMSARLLQRSMELAWRHAFEHRPAEFWLPGLS